MHELLMNIDHMLLLYSLAGLALLLAALVITFILLHRKMQETRRLSEKIDQMVNQVLDISDKSDFNVRSAQF